jgi:hypothetical protein
VERFQKATKGKEISVDVLRDRFVSKSHPVSHMWVSARSCKPLRQLCYGIVEVVRECSV